MTNDPINPRHYRNHPSGVECITITEHFNFNLGNAIKYIWRSQEKEDLVKLEQLRKAEWYVKRELARLERSRPTMPKGTKVHKTYEALKEKGMPEGQAARIAQSKTGQSLKTGKKPKNK